ncbi:RagB/SusD family nutrient uptake outer membrane protein [Mariniflexile sp. HNIBRBA6329]|uniref:RagB/SusD family nutrient uptake outer membrane protein n=1 Tax=Mariniflexile sp. HNIBRBA6329 TaxID=3373088 RepID=UPI00374638D2
MKKILNLKRSLAVISLLLVTMSCDIDEVNREVQDTNLVYTSVVGYEGLINYAYNSLYYFYGKLDGIGAQELGTDLWWSESYLAPYTQYGSELTTTQGQNRVFWDGFYAAVNYSNLAIYYADKVTDYTEDQKKAKVAEAHFIRGWSYLQIVEQYGGVVLRTLPSSIDSEKENFPIRSSEEKIYELILSDLEFAAENLPVSQGTERGRASKKAALGMLAKAYLQRTRLGDEVTYATKALAVAKDLIDNQVAYGCALYTSDPTTSGYAKLWDGLNNKMNTEFLFLESIDPVLETLANPEGSNRGRTRQYYEMDLRHVGEDWGTTQSEDQWYGRANSRGLKPTKYLLTEIFTPEKDPADTRFENTFFTEYYNSRRSGSSFQNWTLTANVINKYVKDPALVGHVIKGTLGTYTEGQVHYGGKTNFYGFVRASQHSNMVDNDNDGWLDGLSIFTPNYAMTASEKYSLPFLIVTPDEMFEPNGKWVTATSLGGLGAYYKDCHPSLNKFSSIHWIFNNQRWMGDVPILRLGDVYLLAAEAVLRSGGSQTTAAEYINTLRKRAAITSRENEMIIAPGEVTLDFILAERARELAGEQVRWEDLKRFGKLNNAYLNVTNPDITGFVDGKHIIRPIPQTFLDAIGNADEFGTNGY